MIDGTVTEADVEAAAIRGAIEILLQPEYGTDWVTEEVFRAFPEEEITDERVDRADNLIMAKLREFAVQLFAELPEANKAGLEHLAE